MKIFRGIGKSKKDDKTSQSVIVSDSVGLPNKQEHVNLIAFAANVDSVLNSNVSGINADYKKAIADMLRTNKSLQE